MAANAMVQTRIKADIKDRAAVVLQAMGLTVSDAIRILLTRTANEGALPLEVLARRDAHDAWFRAKVLQVLEDARPVAEDVDTKDRSCGRRTLAPGQGAS
ncbi:type II toxin-antitoxin system RelB/DinJ family antitoxin [Ensifer sp.]|jgi:DNA-damage-inducible protein J|uniref:type II toxin-antitoxin system RelB/DinJ family antitoxin n=1 Tax=Ensifer sp. TaxID=1872086 RepID=UPI002E111D7D|nr:type II toxin-antitoxin system RelB/DinJ family antitoxin [Ensifer sp.]